MFKHHSPLPLRYRRETIGVLVGLVLVANGCSSSSANKATSAPVVETSVSSTAPVESTTTIAAEAPTTTTGAATTTEAPTTSTMPAAAPLTLRSDGVGSFDFGMTYTDVAAGITGQLEALTDEALEFPVVDEYGGYRTTDESQGFIAPFGRIACWADGATSNFCAAFGGAAPEALSFVGWTYSGSALSTTSGVTGGSLWSDFPTMLTAGQGGCFQESSGSIDGVTVSVVSTGAPFGSYDDAGNLIPSNPAPTDVSVTSLDAGDYPYDTQADC